MEKAMAKAGKKDVFAPDPHHFRIFPGADASGTHRYFI